MTTTDIEKEIGDSAADYGDIRQSNRDVGGKICEASLYQPGKSWRQL